MQKILFWVLVAVAVLFLVTFIGDVMGSPAVGSTEQYGIDEAVAFTYVAHTPTAAEKALRQSINNYRVANGLPTYGGSSALNALAYDQAKKNALNDTLKYPTWETVVNYVGFNTMGVESNAAVGPDRTWVLNTWKANARMRGVLLNEDCTLIGVGQASGNKALYGGITPRFWVMVVRTPAGFINTKAYFQVGIPGQDANGLPVFTPIGDPTPVPVEWGGQYAPLP